MMSKFSIITASSGRTSRARTQPFANCQIPRSPSVPPYILCHVPVPLGSKELTQYFKPRKTLDMYPALLLFFSVRLLVHYSDFCPHFQPLLSQVPSSSTTSWGSLCSQINCSLRSHGSHTDRHHQTIARSFSAFWRHCMWRITHTRRQTPSAHHSRSCSFSAFGRHCLRRITHADRCHLPIAHVAHSIGAR